VAKTMLIAGALFYKFEEITTARRAAMLTRQLNPKWTQNQKASKFGKRRKPVEKSIFNAGAVKIHPYKDYYGGVWVARHASKSVDISGATDATSWPLRTKEEANEARCDLELRPHQTEAVKDWRRLDGDGVCVMPTGAGKTITGVHIAASCASKVLILVPSIDLMEQWKQTIEKHTRVKVVKWSNKRGKTGNITIATFQSIARLDLVDAWSMGERHGLVIADECHRVSAVTFGQVMASLPCRKRLGFTATPDRDDGLGEWVTQTCGPIFHTVKDEDVEGLGYVLKPSVRFVRHGWDDDFNGLLDRLQNDIQRNHLIANTARNRVNEGGSVLILTKRVKHVEILTRYLASELGEEKVRALHSKVKDRLEIIQAARDGVCRVLIATTIADEGLDIPRLDTLICAMPVSAVERVKQRVGRIRRPCNGKLEPVVYLIDDNDVIVSRCLTKVKKLCRDSKWI